MTGRLRYVLAVGVLIGVAFLVPGDRRTAEERSRQDLYAALVPAEAARDSMTPVFRSGYTVKGGLSLVVQWADPDVAVDTVVVGVRDARGVVRWPMQPSARSIVRPVPVSAAYDVCLVFVLPGPIYTRVACSQRMRVDRDSTVGRAA
jgi:hypothetical protein